MAFVQSFNHSYSERDLQFILFALDKLELLHKHYCNKIRFCRDTVQFWHGFTSGFTEVRIDRSLWMQVLNSKCYNKAHFKKKSFCINIIWNHY